MPVDHLADSLAAHQQPAKRRSSWTFTRVGRTSVLGGSLLLCALQAYADDATTAEDRKSVV